MRTTYIPDARNPFSRGLGHLVFHVYMSYYLYIERGREWERKGMGYVHGQGEQALLTNYVQAHDNRLILIAELTK